MSMDDLGDRMKMYEEAWANGPPDRDGTLHGYDPICIRLDGRAFHTFAKGLAKPQDPRMVALMVSTAKRVAEEIHATVAYTQSDEITLVLILENKERDEGKLFFGGRPQKLCSILAAVASVHFNRELAQALPEKAHLTPVFDCRVWNVPGEKEAANVLLWRELDAFKNGVSSLARCHFEDGELHGKGRADMIAMLASKGVTLDDQPDHLFHGTYLKRTKFVRPYTTEERDDLPPKHEARTNPNLMVTRYKMAPLDIPPLRLLANVPRVLFHGDEPVLRPVAEVIAP